MRLQKLDFKNCKLLSVDIYDTLLVRLLNEPTDLFKELGKNLTNIQSQVYYTNDEFKEIRINSEKKARIASKNKYNEVNIYDIYNHFPNNLENINSVLEHELILEEKFSFINDFILNIIIKAYTNNIPVILVSDMYIPKDKMLHILETNNFNISYLDNIFMSCDFKKNKSSGSIWDLVLNTYSHLNPKSIFHIGDNFTSDVLIPRNFKIKTFHYKTGSSKKSDLFEYENVFIKHPLFINSIRKLAINQKTSSHTTEDELGGAILGPILTFFIDWVIDIAINEKKTSIYSFTRESETFIPLLRNAIYRRGLNLKICELYVSRESTWLASLNKWDIDTCNDVLNKYQFSVKDVFTTLSLKIPKFYSERFLKTKVKKIPTIQIKKLKEYLLTPEVKRSIEIKIRNSSKNLMGYFNSLNIDYKKSIFLDLGFSGSISNNIEIVLKKNNIDSKITHLLVFANNSLLKLKTKSIDIRSCLSAPFMNQTMSRVIYSSLMPIEQMILGRNGSVKGYNSYNLNHSPILHKYSCSSYDLKIKDKVLDAIIRYQELWYDNYGIIIDLYKNSYDLRKFKKSLLSTVFRLINYPRYTEAKLLGNLYHDVNSGSSTVRRICLTNEDKLVRSCKNIDSFSNIARKHLVHWPQGIISRSNSNYFLKHNLLKTDNGSYFYLMNLIIENCNLNTFKSIVVYGAGEVGYALCKACKINNIKVDFIIDRKKCLHGTQINNIDVVPIDFINNTHTHSPIVIASFEYSKQIRRELNSFAKKQKLKLTIFSIEDV